MEIERLGENKIRCALSEEEIREMGYNIDEIIGNTEVTQEFMRAVVELVEEQGNISMQNISPVVKAELLQDHSMAITFGGDSEMSFKNLVDTVGQLMNQLAPEKLSEFRQMNKEIKEEEVGRLYHNMGVAEAKLFRFENAKINFIKAYQYTGEESSLFYYYCIMALADGIEAAGEELKTFEDSDFLLDAFEEQFAAFEEDFAYSAMAEKYRKIVFLDENGKPEEALAKKQRLVSALKKDFRKEIDI